jgi:hypothetical protein
MLQDNESDCENYRLDAPGGGVTGWGGEAEAGVTWVAGCRWLVRVRGCGYCWVPVSGTAPAEALGRVAGRLTWVLEAWVL